MLLRLRYPTDLRGGVENYLTRLAELLRGAETVGEVGASAWGEVAREHAITRVRLGFDVTQFFHEPVVFRRVLSEQLARTGRVVGPTGNAQRLIDLIDEANNASIKSYVEFRDSAVRRTQAEPQVPLRADPEPTQSAIQSKVRRSHPMTTALTRHGPNSMD
jgi:hypothetical protein